MDSEKYRTVSWQECQWRDKVRTNRIDPLQVLFQTMEVISSNASMVMSAGCYSPVLIF